MARRVTLGLGLKKYEAVHRLADGRGKEARIAKSLLRLLLVDMTRLYNACQHEGVELEEKGGKS